MAKKSFADRFMDAADSASKAGDDLTKQRGSYSLTGRDGRRSPRDIHQRPSGGTRTLDPLHVLELTDSISALGLLQPIAIDKNNCLVAGEHRLEACKLLDLEDSKDRLHHWEMILSQTDKVIKKSEREGVEKKILSINCNDHRKRYSDQQIPVLMLPFDAKKDQAMSLAAETAENEKRQNYTKQEIIALADRLRDAGYIERAGRPKKGEKSIKSALSVISGKSLRQIERDLSKPKTPTHDGVLDIERHLFHVMKTLKKFTDKHEDHELSNSFKNLNSKISKHIEKSRSQELSPDK
jgi:ParB family chromosome partitioning protein